MYGIRGKKGATSDGNSVDLIVGSKLELDMWIHGLQVWDNSIKIFLVSYLDAGGPETRPRKSVY